MDRFARLTGRQYRLFEYHGAPDAERVIVMMGSGAGDGARDGRCAERRAARRSACSRCGCFGRSAPRHSSPRCRRAVERDRRARPHQGAGRARRAALPGRGHRARRGAHGRQLRRAAFPRVIGGRYGLGSKEFTPAMVKAVFDELAAGAPEARTSPSASSTTSRITSLAYRRRRSTTEPDARRARGVLRPRLRRHGRRQQELDQDHRRGDRLFAQGYFVYDSKKSGSMTVSHLRFGPQPIRSTYLIDAAQFVACHQWACWRGSTCWRTPPTARPFLLNSPYGPEDDLGRAAGRGAAADPRPSGCGCSPSTATASPRRPAPASASTPCSRPASSRYRESCRARLLWRR